MMKTAGRCRFAALRPDSEAPVANQVSVQNASPRTIAAVHARVRKGEVPKKFRRYLDQVYAAARAGVVRLDGQNVFVYRPAAGRPDDLEVDFGVGITAPFSPAGNVQPAQLPVGRVATATHWGSYAGLGAAHKAVAAYCHEQGLSDSGWLVSPVISQRVNHQHPARSVEGVVPRRRFRWRCVVLDCFNFGYWN